MNFADILSRTADLEELDTVLSTAPALHAHNLQPLRSRLAADLQATFDRLFDLIESRTDLHDRRLISVTIATEDDAWRGNNNPYDCPCRVNDLLVTYCGYQLGSVPWTVNLGPVSEY